MKTLKDFFRKEPYYSIHIEGDFSNWSLAGESGVGEAHEKVEITADCAESEGVVSQITTVKNISETDVILNHISSMLVNGIGKNEPDSYNIYFCKSTWQGEAQWINHSMAELGICDASNHVNLSAAKLSFCGSQTTSEYFPVVVIENKKENESWIFEIEPSYGWYFEIGIKEGMIYVEANAAFIGNGGWYKRLAPGECYKTSKAFFAVAEGDIYSAVRLMYGYKRKNSTQSFDTPPVIFNDYMNCLWAKPTDKKLLPLIDAASKVGCEIFCIDDGWYGKEQGWNSLGDWYPNNSLFGELGLEGIIKYITEKGMKPGIWLEMESCSAKSEVYKRLNNCLLRRNGIIIGGSRPFMDFRCVEVQDYTMSHLDYLYKIGVRYIKNDYNHNIRVGCDGSDSLCEGLSEHRKAFLSFIDKVRKVYPDLLIECCSSGAMRADFGFVKHMDLQSVSDQEIYYNNPSIAAGMLAYLPPERCGLWAYPYPLLYNDQPEEKNYFQSKITSNSEETVFNMINSMLGIMCLSGHIEFCSDEDLRLIQEGIEIYKSYRQHITKAVPVYITDPLAIGQNGVMALGLETEIGTIAAIWKINSESECVNIKIPDKYSKAELIYPCDRNFKYSFSNGILGFKNKDRYMARLFILR